VVVVHSLARYYRNFIVILLCMRRSLKWLLFSKFNDYNFVNLLDLPFNNTVRTYLGFVLDWNTQLMLGGRVQIMKLVLYYCLTAVSVFLVVVKFLQSPQLI